jgi:hypothetical protein
MTKDEVIKEMQLAHDIHKDWAKHQRQLKSIGRRLSPNAGDERWHQRWMKTYKETIKLLKA